MKNFFNLLLFSYSWELRYYKKNWKEQSSIIWEELYTFIVASARLFIIPFIIAFVLIRPFWMAIFENHRLTKIMERRVKEDNLIMGYCKKF